jgi:protein involved in polysaccharide export with SLBB domain
MTILTSFSRTAMASLVIFTLSAQAQIKAPAIDETATGNDNAAVNASPSGISQAISIAKPADTLSNLTRDIGKTGGDLPVTIKATESVKRVRAPARPEAPSQFQRFVQEATGKSLAHFGGPLFDAPDNYDPDNSLPVPANYILGPGDEIRLQVWGAVDFNATLVIDRNGQVLVPKVGVVPLNGVAMRDLEGVLRGSLSKVFANFSLNANLGRLRSIQIYVMGQAKQPGTFVVSSLSTLVNALLISGGPNTSGSMRHIQLQRNGKTVTEFDLYDLIAKGDKSKDAPLLPGDVIVIPPAGPRVAVTGAYDQTGIYELKDASTNLADILALGGGALSTANTQKVLLERITPGQIPARQVQDLALDAAGLKQTLRDADVITLLPISPAFSNAVTLRGNVAFPLRYAFRPGMKVSDLIPESGALIQSDYYSRKNIMVQRETGKAVTGERVINDVKNLLEEINWDYAAIERLNRKDVRTELIPFNLSKAINDKDPANNLLLQAGDIVTIFGVNDLPVPLEKRTQFARISGEVMVPGVYQIKPGDTLPDLIKRAGGLSSNAFAYGTVFTRESTRVQQQDNLNKSISRMEKEINAQNASALQNVTDSEKGSVLQSQIAGQRILLSRMQGLKASGRISLELDPNNPAPPPIALENGDEISIPHRPSFVGVFGEVLAENSFIHKQNFSVNDYLDKAGLTRDADTDNLMVIRADGTVESNARRSSFLSAGLMGKKVNPGDTIFVPGVIDRRSAYSQFIQGAKDWTTILYQFGLGAAALKTIRN